MHTSSTQCASRCSRLSITLLTRLLPLAGACVLLFVGLGTYASHTEQKAIFLNNLNQTTQLQARLLATPLAQHNTQKIRNILEAWKANSSLWQIEVVDANNSPVAIILSQEATDKENAFSISKPIHSPDPANNPKKIGELHIFAPKRNFITFSTRLWIDLSGLAALLALITTCVLYVQKNTTSKPLALLLASLRKAENEQRVAPVTWTAKDEIGQLVNHCNDLLLKYGDLGRDTQGSEKKYRDIFNNAQMGILITHAADGTILDANKKMAEIVGYDSVDDFKLLKAGQIYSNPSTRPELIKQLRSKGTTPNFPAEIKRRDGTSAWLELTATLDTQTQVIISVGQDVTEQVELQKALVNAKLKAEEANKSKARFLAHISNEILTPMHGIIGLGKLAHQEKALFLKDEHIEKILATASGFVRAVNDVLDFSNIESGKLLLGKNTFDLYQVLELTSTLSSLPAISPIALTEEIPTRKDTVEVIYSLGPNVPRFLVGDNVRLGQVLTNIINNAIKFTEQGEIIIDIQVKEAHQPQPRLFFSVRDTGLGLPPELLEKVFEPFSLLQNPLMQKHGGLGLGLAISKHLVELMGGTIKVGCEKGEGATFCFDIPFETPEQEHALLMENKNNMAFTMEPPPRVLVVAQNVKTLEATRFMATQLNLRTDTAHTALKAVQKCLDSVRQTQPYHVLLIDWHLPEMDGLELASLLQGLPAFQNIPLLLCANAPELARLKTKASHIIASGFLAKPILPATLYASIMAALGQTEHQEQWAQQLIDLAQVNELAPPPPKDSTSPTATNAPPATENPRVLLVEDSLINRTVTQMALKNMGVIVETALDGAEALQAIQEKHFDIVLMDISMPVMDGIQATQQIRALPRGNMPILGLSALTEKSDKQHGLDAGMNEYLEKPLSSKKLRQALRQWLPKFTQYQSNTESNNNPASAVPAFGPSIDTAYALDLVDGQKDLYLNITNQFTHLYPHTVRTVQECLDKGDVQSAIRLVHSIQSAAQSVGARALHNVAKSLELALRNAPVEQAQPLLSQFKESLEQALKDLNGA